MVPALNPARQSSAIIARGTRHPDPVPAPMARKREAIYMGKTSLQIGLGIRPADTPHVRDSSRRELRRPNFGQRATADVVSELYLGCVHQYFCHFVK